MKSEALVLNWKREERLFWVRDELLPKVKEFVVSRGHVHEWRRVGGQQTDWCCCCIDLNVYIERKCNKGP